jgi:magnesium transporter
MAKRNRKPRVRRGIKSGMAPGTPVFIGERRREHTRIDVLDFSVTEFHEHAGTTLEQACTLAQSPSVTWINIAGVHDLALLETLGQRFQLHPLTLEDIANTMQRPKVEESPGYLFIVLKMLSFREQPARVEQEQVSLILGDGYVLSFLEDQGDVFDSVRNRIRQSNGRLRHMQADFLLYLLMDAVVDHYFLAVEGLGECIEEIDERLLVDARREDIREIHRLRSEVLKLRRAVWPLREGVAALEKSASPLIQSGTRVFLRDLYDHGVQVIDMVEANRDILAGMHDTWLSSNANRMNEIMKVLTIISTLFIPLTFIAGVYGMNFRFMPELQWRWGYPAAWLLMLAIGGGMLAWFRWRGWFR